MRVKLGDIAAAFGKGIFAGAAGTAAMTVSSTIEMKVRGRPASSAPARAAAKVLGVEPVNEQSEARFSNLVHWGYGTAWGGARGAPRGNGTFLACGDSSTLRGCLGQRAGYATNARGRASFHRVGSKGSSYRRASPPRVCGSHGDSLFTA